MNQTVSARAATASPELAAELKDLVIIRNAYTGAFETARTAIRQAVPSLRARHAA